MDEAAPKTRLSVERVRITRVGVWYLVVVFVVAVAAINTGNNALFLVLGGLLALLVASGLISRRNLRRMDLEPGRVGEVYARRPFSVPLRLVNRDRWMARRFLEIAAGPDAEPLVVPFVPPASAHRERLAFCFRRRGRHVLEGFRVLSIFPLGLFQKAMRHHRRLEVLVYPEILPLDSDNLFALGRIGEEPSPRMGQGHDLYAMRYFRTGDDPRGIHWKRTARTGELIYMEREADEGKRLLILLDNAVAPLVDEAAEEGFERLVSEAASAAVEFLERGFEVALTTRTDTVAFGRGAMHRRRLLEILALLQAVPFEPVPLEGASTEGAPELRLDTRRPPLPTLETADTAETAP